MSRSIFLLVGLLVGCSAAQQAAEAPYVRGAARWEIYWDQQCESGILARAKDPRIADFCVVQEMAGRGAP